MNIQYVVIEWNQASHQPSIVGGLTADLDEALENASDLRQSAADVGRRERFTVHPIDLDDQEGDDNA